MQQLYRGRGMLSLAPITITHSLTNTISDSLPIFVVRKHVRVDPRIANSTDASETATDNRAMIVIAYTSRSPTLKTLAFKTDAAQSLQPKVAQSPPCIHVIKAFESLSRGHQIATRVDYTE